MIKKCEYEFPSPFFDNISENAKDLIKRILVADPKQRLTADEMMQHPWIAGGEQIPITDLSSVPKTMKEFNIKRKFKVFFLFMKFIFYRKLDTQLWLQEECKN